LTSPGCGPAAPATCATAPAARQPAIPAHGHPPGGQDNSRTQGNLLGAGAGSGRHADKLDGYDPRNSSLRSGQGNKARQAARSLHLAVRAGGLRFRHAYPAAKPPYAAAGQCPARRPCGCSMISSRVAPGDSTWGEHPADWNQDYWDVHDEQN